MFIGSLRPKGRRLVVGGTVQFWQPAAPRRSDGLGLDLSRVGDALLSRVALPSPAAATSTAPLGASAAPMTTAAASVRSGGLLGGLGKVVGNLFNVGKSAGQSAGSFSAGFREVTGEAPPAVPIGGLVTQAKAAIEKFTKKEAAPQAAPIYAAADPVVSSGGGNMLLYGGLAVAGIAAGALLLRGGRR